MILARYRAGRFLGQAALILLIFLAAIGPFLSWVHSFPLSWLPFLALPPSLLLATVFQLSDEERSGESLAYSQLGLGPLRRAVPLGLTAMLLWVPAGLIPALDKNLSVKKTDPQDLPIRGLARMDLGPKQQALLGPGNLLVLPSHQDQAPFSHPPRFALALRWDAAPRWIPISTLSRTPKGLRLPPLDPKKGEKKGDTLSFYPDRRSAALRRAFLGTPPVPAILALGSSGWATPNLLALWTLHLCFFLPFFLTACTHRFRDPHTWHLSSEKTYGPTLLPWFLLIAGIIPALLGIQMLLLIEAKILSSFLGAVLSLGLLPLGTALVLAPIPWPSLFSRPYAPKNYD